jgi:hypothetical protein
MNSSLRCTRPLTFVAVGVKALRQAEPIGLVGHRAPLLRNFHIFLRKRIPSVLAGVFRPLLAMRGIFAAFVGFCYRHVFALR